MRYLYITVEINSSAKSKTFTYSFWLIFIAILMKEFSFAIGQHLLKKVKKAKPVKAVYNMYYKRNLQT